MKKVLANLFGQSKSSERFDEGAAASNEPHENRDDRAALNPPIRAKLEVVPQTKTNEFVGKRNGYAVVIVFPEFHELAPFLSAEGSAKFIRDFRHAIDNSMTGFVGLVELSDSAQATIAIDESAKQTPNAMMTVINELYNELQLWVGTFGRTGMPPLKYRMGVARGEITIATKSPSAPLSPETSSGSRISGPAVMDAREIAEKFCADFEIKLGVSADIVRASSDAVSWLDLDDRCFQSSIESGKPKAIRIFSKLTERLDPEDIQMIRAARKAYFLQNWEEAAAKFDRLTMLNQFRQLSNIYIHRIELLKKRPKDPQWDGVYRV